MKGFVKFKLCC